MGVWGRAEGALLKLGLSDPVALAKEKWAERLFTAKR